MNRFKATRLDAETLQCEYHIFRSLRLQTILTQLVVVIAKHIPQCPLDVPDIDPETEEGVSMPCEGYDIMTMRPQPLRHIEE